MKIFLSSGEVSGDHLAASLLKALKERIPGIDCWGMGGGQSRAAGMRTVWPSEELQLMGISEVFSSIPRLLALKAEMCRRILGEKPDAVVVVDSPDFHFPLISQLRRAGFGGKIVYLAPPQVWAWRSGRVSFLKEACDLCLPLFDFEHDFLAVKGVPTAWTGHPFVDEFPALEKGHDPEERGRRVAMLPGSRPGEVRRLLPILCPTALGLRDRGFEPVFSIAPGLKAKDRERLVGSLQGFETYEGEGRALMAESCCVIGASGTAAVEAMMLDLFMIVLYRVSLSSEIVFRLFVKTPFISIPNRLAEGRLYPELVQSGANPEEVLRHFDRHWQDRGERNGFHEKLKMARERMGKPEAARFWADMILQALGSP